MSSPPPTDFTATIEDFLAGDPRVTRSAVEAILTHKDASKDTKAQAHEALAWADTSQQLRAELTPPAGARERLLAKLRAANEGTDETAVPSAASFFPAGDPFADTFEAFFDGRLNRDEVDQMINDPKAERGFRRDLAETLTLTDALRRAHAKLEPEPGARDRLLDAIAQLAADETEQTLDDDEDAPAPIPFPGLSSATPDLLAAGLDSIDDAESLPDNPDANAPSADDPDSSEPPPSRP
ncbi:MAG: hypothetical protein AAGI68_10920 [Planctomycetota bacterium]